jgi:RimJ/RimL family protein N-acetyltransferase
LVASGGSDPRRLLTNIVQGLAVVSSRQLEIRIVMGGSNPDGLPSISQDRHSFQFERNPSDMSRLMAWAEVAVSAAGSTCWELCAMGVPAIVIDVAENQRPIAEGLGRQRIAVHVPFEEATAERIAQELGGLMGSAERRANMSREGRELVDGRGADRVVAVMRAQGLTMRRTTQDDCRQLWGWANDPATRRASFHSAEIPWEEHRSWFGMKLKDRRCLMLIAEEGGAAIGAVRFERNDSSEAELSITVAPESRGAGLATYLIERATDRAMDELEVDAICAWIKTENRASIRAFEHAGFQFVREAQRSGAEAVGCVKSRRRRQYGAAESRVAAGGER